MKVPAGTEIPVVLDSTVASDSNKVEDPVRGHIGSDVVIGGKTAFERGTPVRGVVTQVKQAGKVKGRAEIAMRFNTIDPPGEENYHVQTRSVSSVAESSKKKDAGRVAIGSAAGAIIGGIAGGGKGAAIGTAVGGGAGTAVVLSTRGKEVQFNEGATFMVHLNAPVTVRVNR